MAQISFCRLSTAVVLYNIILYYFTQYYNVTKLFSRFTKKKRTMETYLETNGVKRKCTKPKIPKKSTHSSKHITYAFYFVSCNSRTL